jgi:soluble lytic murein transglycosylase-like protein
MKDRLSALLVVLLLSPAFPVSAQVAAEDPALAARIATPLREELLNRMDSWRPILFPATENDEVRARYGARYDALQQAVRGQKHPGDIARSKYAFNQLLEDALHERYKQEKRAATTSDKFGAYRDQAARRAEASAASETAAAVVAREASRRVADLPQIPAATLFDGSMIGGQTAPPPPPAVPVLPSRSLAGFTMLPPTVVPRSLYVEAQDAQGYDRYRKVREILISQGVDSKIILLLALSQQESRFNPKATSRVGARGLMQIMPETAGDYGVTNADDLYDPAVNIRVGIEHFKRLCAQFAGAGMCGSAGFDTTRRGSALATASWNAGEGNVIKYGGVPPFQETRDFVKKVLAYYDKFAAMLK